MLEFGQFPTNLWLILPFNGFLCACYHKSSFESGSKSLFTVLESKLRIPAYVLYSVRYVNFCVLISSILYLKVVLL